LQLDRSSFFHVLDDGDERKERCTGGTEKQLHALTDFVSWNEERRNSN